MTSHVARVLDVTADVCRTAEVPADPAERHELETAMVNVIDAMAGLCQGDPDRLGICCDCGKVVARDRNGHDPGGCLFAIPLAIGFHLRRLPRRLWLRGRYHLRGSK